MNLGEYILLAASSLFVIMDPLALVPVFLAMTPNDPPARRLRFARLACLVAAGVLIIFALVGKWIFKFLGITLPAFQMAACIVLLLVALDMLQAKPTSTRESPEEREAGAAKEDIAITPLAVPLLAGPGAISTTLLLQSKATTMAHKIALLGCIIAVSFVSYVILRLATKGGDWLSPIAMKIATRLMGLLLAAIAFQFLLNALQELARQHFF